MPAVASLDQLAREREDAAEDLEAAIARLGLKWRDYVQVTADLGERGGMDLQRRLEVPIVLHMMHAGLGPFLERKLQGPPAPLRELIESEHARIALLA